MNASDTFLIAAPDTSLDSVNYGGAKYVAVKEVEVLIASKEIEKHDPLTQVLLERIRRSASRSRDMEIGMYQILEEQGFVDDE